jgi:hypothetical protein
LGKNLLLWSKVLLKGSHQSCQDNLAECLPGKGNKSYAPPILAISKINSKMRPGFRDFTFYPNLFEAQSEWEMSHLHLPSTSLLLPPSTPGALPLFIALIAVATTTLDGSVQTSRSISAGWMSAN